MEDTYEKRLGMLATAPQGEEWSSQSGVVVVYPDRYEIEDDDVLKPVPQDIPVKPYDRDWRKSAA